MLTIKTTKLQEILARAIKGAGANNLVPLTTLIALEVKGGSLRATTTLDKRNYLYCMDKVGGDDFYACVSIDIFPKLISKMTCEDVTLDIKDKHLEVVGNGKYQIDLQLDENGDLVQFPNPLSDFSLDDSKMVGMTTLTTVKEILTKVRPSLSTSQAQAQYMNYYVGNAITATDNTKISSLAVKLFGDESRLVTVEMVDLLDTFVDDAIKIYADGNKLAFVTEHGIVYGYTSDGVEMFKIDAIMDYISKDYPSKCKISKVELLQVLDRIGLFVGSLDAGIINLSFEEQGLVIKSRQSNGLETVSYLECEDFAPKSGDVILDRLRTQVKAQSGDTIDMYFGDDKSIKMVDDNCTLVVALGDS